MENKLVVIGNVAAFGTKEILIKKRNELTLLFSTDYLQKALEHCNTEYDEKSLLNIINKEINNIELYGVSKGGILSAIWYFCEKKKYGIKYYQKKIPILQCTIEICEKYRLNPYRLISKKVFILEAGYQESLNIIEELKHYNIPCDIIGDLTTKNEIRVRQDIEEHSFLTKEKKDEIEKIFPLYFRKNK